MNYKKRPEKILFSLGLFLFINLDELSPSSTNPLLLHKKSCLGKLLYWSKVTDSTKMLITQLSYTKHPNFQKGNTSLNEHYLYF